MHPLAHIDLAHAHESDLQRSHNSPLTTAVSVREAPRALEPVTRDPFIDALEPASPVEGTSLVVGSVSLLAPRAVHKRKRDRATTTLLAARPPKHSDRGSAGPRAAIRR